MLGRYGKGGNSQKTWKAGKPFRLWIISCLILHFCDPQCCYEEKRLLQYLAELQILEIHSLLPTNLIEFGWCDLGRGTSKLESSRKLPANATVSVRFTTKCGAPPGTNKVCRQLWQLAIGTLTTMTWWTIMKLNWNDTSSYSTGYGHVQHDAHFASIESTSKSEPLQGQSLQVPRPLQAQHQSVGLVEKW